MPEDFTHHPTRELLEGFVHGKLNPTDRQMVENHVDLCDRCCDILRKIPHDELVQEIRAFTTLDFARKETSGDTLASNAPFESPEAEIPPALLNHDRYQIIKRLGAGGMGTVYLAQHRVMGRTVALKVINDRLLQNEAFVKRFRLEIETAARLSHRNIVTAYDAVQLEDLHFFVMEYVEGMDLQSMVISQGRLSVQEASDYILQTALGLQHAHEGKMVHRDIKPQNLMCTPDGIIKILDFGLARLMRSQDAESKLTGLTEEGVTLGTPDFIAPEQARDSRQVDIRSDIYSLGCTFYYLLAGVVPFPNGTAVEKVISHCEFAPEPLVNFRNDIPDAVIQMIERMMAKKPADRFQTPQELADAITTSIVSRQIPNSQSLGTKIERAEEQNLSSLFSRHRRTLVSSIILISAVLTLIIAYSLPHSAVNNPATANWIDLIPPINLSQDVVAGEWAKRGAELSVDAEEWARLALPFSPPDEYDFELQFTRHSGTQSIAVFFVLGTGQASFEIDAWDEQLAGIQNIDNLDIRNNPTRVAQKSLRNGQTYIVLLKVRRGTVEVSLDGIPLTTFKSDGSNLSMLDTWSLPSSKSLGVGAYDSSTTFHRIRIRPVESR
ncbi:MAG: protein kinase [Gimesia sp.]|nr:protein kinase [Gimesia sp.]